MYQLPIHNLHVIAIHGQMEIRMMRVIIRHPPLSIMKLLGYLQQDQMQLGRMFTQPA